jgi:hypothetical protein
MRKKQLGLNLGGLLAVCVVIIALVMLGLKMVPSYIEYFSIKKAVVALGEESRGGTSVADIRKDFDKRATIDAVSTVSGKDLDITKDGPDVVISVSYRKEIPLVANVGLYIDFLATSKP